MDLSGVLQDARLDGLASFLHIKTKAGADAIHTGLRQWSSASAILQKRTTLIAQLRERLGVTSAVDATSAIQSAFETIAVHESVLRSFWSPPTEMEDEGYSQLLFRGEYTIPLNHIPRLLSVWAALKIFILPAMQVSTPLLTFIAPFIIVKFVMKMPLTFKQYFKIAKGMFLGGGMSKLFSGMQEMPAMPELSQIPGMSALPSSITDTARTWMQTGWIIISAVQSIMQPIQSAKHTRRLKLLIDEKAAALNDYIEAVRGLSDAFRRLGVRTARIPVPADVQADPNRLIAFALENPAALQMMDRAVGRYELWYRLAVSEYITPAIWRTAAAPMFCFKGICDIGISPAKQRSFSVRIGGGRQHALLTGPNRGGKSTALRAVLRNLVLAHCFGAGIGSHIELTPFDWIQSCLRLEDLPGRASLFEREVAFAAASLGRPANKRGAVFVDELFHSTNPPDAAAASAHYLQQLWDRPQIVSIISTHVFELVDGAPANIQRLCCPADLRADGSVEYKYGLARGICKVSSVGEILLEQGLGSVPANASSTTK